jgi:hypothetical protein
MRALAILAVVTACNGFDLPAQPMGSAHPIANAGTGSSYPLGTTVVLDGSGSFDPAGGALAYHWSIVQSPSGSAAEPADASAAMTTFVPDLYGAYVLQLEVSDAAHDTDASDLRLVATGAITSIDAGPPGTVSWLGTAQLAGSVSVAQGLSATYSWAFVSRPAGSMASLTDATSLTPTFVADAVGTYVVALDAAVGDDVREDTATIEATATGGVSIGTNITAYAFSKSNDHILYVDSVAGRAEIVQVDPTTGAKVALDLGPFTPRSIAVDSNSGVYAVGMLGRVTTVNAMTFHLFAAKPVPGCTAAHVTVPFDTRVDCFPADGTTEPISSVDMNTGVVTQIPCPVQFPDVAISRTGNDMYMVDGASPQFYLYDAFSTPPLSVISHGSLAGIAPPVIPSAGGSDFAVTGNGLVVNPDATLRFDLHMPVSAGAVSALRGDIAVVSGAQLTVFSSDGQVVLMSAVLPPVGGMSPTPRLVAYSADDHRLIIVVGSSAGDVAYTVPR